MNEDDWDGLIGRIDAGRCTPFLGAGAAVPTLPLGGDIAERWATQHCYPLKDDKRDLPRIAQYLAVCRDPMFPKELFDKEFSSTPPPDFTDPCEPHRALADLNLPLYMTTNYDGFMAEALRERARAPVQEACKWNNSPSLKKAPSPLWSDAAFEPTPANPVVFHLHGYFGLPESLVLTEDDYLAFLVAV